MKKELKVVGWREWVTLPDLEINHIKAKVDSGAGTSSLHAFDLDIYKRGKNEFVKFTIHPQQRSDKGEKVCRAKILEYRKIKSSNGQSELRPVILTVIHLHGEDHEVEVTLTNRDAMGFRMLLGRESIRNRFLIHTGKSYCGNKPPKSKSK